MKSSIIKIDKQIALLAARKSKIQNHCKHPNVVIKHCGDTGNYNPSSDVYWKEMSCPDCGKFWTEDE